MNNTSTMDKAQPATKGICGIRRLIAIAVPMTSAISVAIIYSCQTPTPLDEYLLTAASAIMYRNIFNHLGRNSLQASARFSPLTLPSLMHRLCKKMAKMLDISTMKRSLNRYVAPAATSVE
jgi:hypothetical protein